MSLSLLGEKGLEGERRGKVSKEKRSEV